VLDLDKLGPLAGHSHFELIQGSKSVTAKAAAAWAAEPFAHQDRAAVVWEVEPSTHQDKAAVA